MYGKKPTKFVNKASVGAMDSTKVASTAAAFEKSPGKTGVQGKAIPDSAVTSLMSNDNTSAVLVGTDDGRHTLSTVEGVLENGGINVIKRSTRVRKKPAKLINMASGLAMHSAEIAAATAAFEKSPRQTGVHGKAILDSAVPSLMSDCDVAISIDIDAAK